MASEEMSPSFRDAGPGKRFDTSCFEAGRAARIGHGTPMPWLPSEAGSWGTISSDCVLFRDDMPNSSFQLRVPQSRVPETPPTPANALVGVPFSPMRVVTNSINPAETCGLSGQRKCPPLNAPTKAPQKCPNRSSLLASTSHNGLDLTSGVATAFIVQPHHNLPLQHHS